MNKKLISLIIATIAAGGLSACAGVNSHDLPDSFYSHRSNEITYSDARHDGLVPTIHNAVDSVLSQMQGRYEGAPLLITSTQKLDSLTVSGTLGRTIGEIISARASEKGFAVVEAKLRSTLVINTQGEQMLSRELKDIADSHRSKAVIVSSWSAGGKIVYVTIKAVRVDDGVVIGSNSFTLPIDDNIKAMLQ